MYPARTRPSGHPGVKNVLDELGSFGVAIQQIEGPGVERSEQLEMIGFPEAALLPLCGRQHDEVGRNEKMLANGRHLVVRPPKAPSANEDERTRQ